VQSKPTHCFRTNALYVLQLTSYRCISILRFFDLPMVACETYASSLIAKGHGYPLWEPDPGEYPPVELADVGYISDGGFIKLFNPSRIDGPSNSLGLPEGHTLFPVGLIHHRAPLPKAPEYISSEGVCETGVDLSVIVGYAPSINAQILSVDFSRRACVFIYTEHQHRLVGVSTLNVLRNKPYSSWAM
jgi:hypothetical protein